MQRINRGRINNEIRDTFASVGRADIATLARGPLPAPSPNGGQFTTATHRGGAARAGQKDLVPRTSNARPTFTVGQWEDDTRSTSAGARRGQSIFDIRGRSAPPVKFVGLCMNEAQCTNAGNGGAS